MKQLQSLKSDLTKTRIVKSQNFSLDKGEIAVVIENFAFTANNVTYGVAGDTIGYWQFFKTAKDEDNLWGCIPCLLYTSPSPRDRQKSRMPSSA